MVGRVALLLALAGCRTLLGFEDPSIAADANRPRDARPCIADGVDLSDLALEEIAFSIDTTISTSDDTACTSVIDIEGQPSCVIAGGNVTIADNAILQVTGNRPLVVFACDTIDVRGRIDGSSNANRSGPAGNSGDCVFSIAQSDLGGGGGGGGGSFVGSGGKGGTGDSDNSVGGDGNALGGAANPTVSPPDAPRGGCPGGPGGNETAGGGVGGAGGSGGGALQLIAGIAVNVPVVGIVEANGAGGRGGAVQAGGGGGGSGGWIRITAPTIVIDGVLAANGGGGGGGGGRINGADVAGEPGENGNNSAVPATGGTGTTVVPAGKGGQGAAGAMPSTNGEDSLVGAGGGGGGVGVIRLSGTVTISGVISPSPLLD